MRVVVGMTLWGSPGVCHGGGGRAMCVAALEPAGALHTRVACLEAELAAAAKRESDAMRERERRAAVLERKEQKAEASTQQWAKRLVSDRLDDAADRVAKGQRLGCGGGRLKLRTPIPSSAESEGWRARRIAVRRDLAVELLEVLDEGLLRLHAVVAAREGARAHLLSREVDHVVEPRRAGRRIGNQPLVQLLELGVSGGGVRVHDVPIVHVHDHVHARRRGFCGSSTGRTHIVAFYAGERLQHYAMTREFGVARDSQGSVFTRS